MTNLLAEEKDLSAGLSQVKVGVLSSSKYLSLWGESEQGLDLQDITQKSAVIAQAYTMALAEWEDSQHKYREKLKELKELSDQLHSLKAKLKACKDRLEKAVKNNKNSESIQAELGGLELHVQDDSAAFESRKRLILADALRIQSEGLARFTLKAQQIAAFQMHLADQIPQFKIKPAKDLSFPPYVGREVTQQIIYDFENAMYRLPKTLPRGKGYSAPQNLNLDDLHLDDFASGAPSKSADELLWDTPIEATEAQSKPLVLEHKTAAQTSGPLWTAFASTESTPVSSVVDLNATAAPASEPSVSSASRPSLLPTHLADNPW
ncbi:hypothetical protein HDV03_000529 [Kappamyces sp. JEL0829]|nr:hypothetical protein HDV03_000529 [Kappamyces sp. JEL0829]